MRYLLVIIGAVALATGIFMAVDWKRPDLSLAPPAVVDVDSDIQAEDSDSEVSLDLEEDSGLWLDTVMYAKGHAFSYSGDLTMWGGWYLDTVCVGYDNMLQYDSVGPSKLRLSLVTRELVVDLGDNDVIDKIKGFMDPIVGFRRHKKSYEECLGTVNYGEVGCFEYMGGFTFEVDYPDSCNGDARKINQMICDLTNLSENEKANFSNLSAFYAGHHKTKHYRRAYSGKSDDINGLSDFLAHMVFENWRREGGMGLGSNDAVLAIRPHVSNSQYVTYSKYEYDRAGIGHGMYTETFHTYDLGTGTKLRNRDLFNNECLDKVKMKLFEVIAKDPHYLAWNAGPLKATEIEERIVRWQSPSPALEGTEWEEPIRDVTFRLPDGALTKTGVVFSFQPYEIDCWAAGAFHFIVPYEKVMEYLTPRIKKWIKIS